MFRLFAAAAFAASLATLTTPASADVKIVTMTKGSHRPSPYVTHHRHFKPFAIAVPRCHMKRRSNGQVHWGALACPRIAWAGSPLRQPWSYDVFRRSAAWHQRLELWQSQFAPSPMHPTIYWGY